VLNASSVVPPTLLSLKEAERSCGNRGSKNLNARTRVVGRKSMSGSTR